MASLARNIPVWRGLAQAGGNFVAARLRALGALGTAIDWESRAAICERCPIRVIKCGVSYCGQPFVQQIDRDPAIDGCGCPCREKAKARKEHCPIDHRQQPADSTSDACSCKWCNPR